MHSNVSGYQVIESSLNCPGVYKNKGLIKGGSAWHTQSTIMKVETAYSVFVDAGSNKDYILLLPKVVASLLAIC